MTSRRVLAVSIGTLVLGSLLVTGSGIGIMPAGADDDKGERQRSPFTQILNKLDQILDKLTNGGSGGQEGNHTVRWDTVQPAATRFVVLADFGNAAVLDKETGLVWKKSPQQDSATWISARFHCTSETTGGRKGWRLPSVHELASLVDPSVALPGPPLPPGHPFLNVRSDGYWSATSILGNPSGAWTVHFGNGDVVIWPKASDQQIWCVRGGHNDGSEH